MAKQDRVPVPAMAQGTKPSTEAVKNAVERPLRPDQLAIRDIKDEWSKKRPEPEIASIERDLGTWVDADYVKMLQSADTEIAGIFNALRTAMRDNGMSLEAHVFVGPKNRETRWGVLMKTMIGLDRQAGNKKRILRPRLERAVGGNVHGAVVAFEAGLNAAALYLKGQYGWDWIPQYKVEPSGVSDDDIKGHDPKVSAARAAEIEAANPKKQIEGKK